MRVAPRYGTLGHSVPISTGPLRRNVHFRMNEHPGWAQQYFPYFPRDPVSWPSRDDDLTYQHIVEGKGNGEFALWLAELLAQPSGPRSTSETALHQYRLPKRNTDHRFFPPKGDVLLYSLWDAAQMYRWRGDDLALAHARLAPLTKAAQSAYGDGVPHDLASTAQAIFRWGGVGGGAKGNSAWVTSNAPQTLRSCAAMHAMHLEKRFSGWMFASQDVRMNSGFTKLYALTFDNFIMYDSRVAAAFALLVARYEAATGKTPAIKRDLCVFRGRTGNRTPEGFSLKTTELSHARANCAANWFIEMLFSRERKIAASWDSHIPSSAGARYRALEAALFMVGYDIGGNFR